MTEEKKQRDGGRFMADVNRLADAAMEAAKEKRPTMVVPTSMVIALTATVKMVDLASSGRVPPSIFGRLGDLGGVGEVQEWHQLHRDATTDHLGLIPSFIDVRDERSLAEQLNESYQHGGGYPSSSQEWISKWIFDGPRSRLIYRTGGDEENEIFPALWSLRVRDEELIVFSSAMVMVRDTTTGKFVVGRMD